jgi:hypothetical protein
MKSPDDLVTVYRSADATAERDATAVYDMLAQGGIEAALCNDSVRGVVSGSWEVRVPVDDAARSEEMMAANGETGMGKLDPSPEFDAVTIMELQGATGEIEAMGIKSILDANEIPNVLVGASTLPNLSFLIQVPAAELERAQTAIREAQAAGPAAAVEAERASEPQV